MTTIGAPDLGALKARQQQTWASGDYAAVAATVPHVSERLVDTAELHPDWRVLDVAGGSGNASIAAARLGCSVVCTDYVPSLLDRARERARAERLPVDVHEADAEALPFGEGSFDAVLSSIGVMFTADHGAAAKEMVRVCRPGGTIGLASWTPDSFVGDMLRAVTRQVPPPAGAQSPLRWGTEEALDDLFGDHVRWTAHDRHVHTFRFRSADHFADFFRDHYGPTHRAFAALDADGQDALRADLLEAVGRHDRGGRDGSVAVQATYLVSVADRV